MKFTVVCVTLSNKATDKKKTAETLSFFCLFETVDQRSASRYHPSTSTKNMTLNGKARTVGGSIIIPIDIRTEAMTISIIRKGTKIKKPISKARRSSLIIKAGTATLSGVSSIVFAGFSSARSVNKSKSFSRVLRTINSFRG